MDGVTEWLELNGFNRASTVREPGDYAVRGGIVDLFPPGMAEPVRLDFFGDTLEIDPQLRSGDPAHDRQLRALDLVPMAEFQLTSETIRRFRTGYVAAFGAAAPDDLLYEAVSEGRRPSGMEHWLPLFHEQAGDAVRLPRRARRSSLEPLAEEAAARAAGADRRLLPGAQGRARSGAAPARPTSRCRRTGSILREGEWRDRLERTALARLSPFAAPERQRRCDRYRRACRPQFRGRAQRARHATSSRR